MRNSRLKQRMGKKRKKTHNFLIRNQFYDRKVSANRRESEKNIVIGMKSEKNVGGCETQIEH